MGDVLHYPFVGTSRLPLGLLPQPVSESGESEKPERPRPRTLSFDRLRLRTHDEEHRPEFSRCGLAATERVDLRPRGQNCRGSTFEAAHNAGRM